jgi:anti-sigma regulatory factor (Ser/Thr protein kinase)
MEVAFTAHVQITDPTSIGEARRAALFSAQRLGFDETKAGQLALLTTEASRNALIHGGGGQVIVTGVRDEHGALARILAMDRGPGIENIGRAMADGFSTAGTMGGGLGAMKRIANSLEIFTSQSGTMVLVELGDALPQNSLQLAGMALPYPGERHCGDGWAFHQTPERTTLLLVDGLGHGLEAADAAQEAITTFERRVQSKPGEIIGFIHDALRKTRGAVGAVAEIRPKDGMINYAGVGNISAVLLSPAGSRSLVSHNGTLGMVTSRIQEFRSEWSPSTTLVLHSDGLQSRWDLAPYAGLLVKHPALIGGALLRDFRRQRDDASVVVVKAAA